MPPFPQWILEQMTKIGVSLVNRTNGRGGTAVLDPSWVCKFLRVPEPIGNHNLWGPGIPIQRRKASSCRPVLGEGGGDTNQTNGWNPNRIKHDVYSGSMCWHLPAVDKLFPCMFRKCVCLLFVVLPVNANLRNTTTEQWEVSCLESISDSPVLSFCWEDQNASVELCPSMPKHLIRSALCQRLCI